MRSWGVGENGAVQAVASDVRLELWGRFRVVVGEHEVAESDWPTRRARELVAVLALADGCWLPRDRVIERLWPHLDARAGAANLRKAAHHAAARWAIGRGSYFVGSGSSCSRHDGWIST